MATDSASSRVREAPGLSGSGVTVVRAGVVAWAGIGLGILAYAAAQVIRALRVPMLALGAAALIVALLEPGVARLERSIPRWGAVSVGMLLAVPAMASAKALYLRFRSPAAAAR